MSCRTIHEWVATVLAGFEKVALQFAVAIDTGPARVDRGVPQVFWPNAGTGTWTAIILAVGARRKPRDQHRDNKTWVSSDFADVEEPARTAQALLQGTAGACFSPFGGRFRPSAGENRQKPAVTLLGATTIEASAACGLPVCPRGGGRK